jgi:uncharacterized repeat protein (TIGR01451 family)
MASSASAASFATLQGQSKGSATWVSGNLSSWEELDPIPMRVWLDPAAADVNNVSTVTIEYDHTKTKGSSVYQGLDRPRNFAVAAGDASKVECLNCSNPVRSEPTGSDTWSVSFQVRPLTAAKSAITFTMRLRAGAHYFTGSSLALSGTASPGGGLGVLQVSKPAPKSGSPDLQLAESGPAVASPGSTIAYTLNYDNNPLATSVATGIQLTDALPSGITYASGCAAPACSVSADGRTLVWDLGDFEIGASGSVSFLASVGSLPYGSVATSTAEIDSAENDANFTDNRASASTEIQFNRAPTADPQSVSTPEETAKTLTLSGSDPDGDSLTYAIVSGPSHGSLTAGATSGTFDYTPNPDYNGADSFSFKVNDGTLDSSIATVSLTVTPVNDAPSATDTSATTPEDAPATVDFRPLVSDVETADANLTYAVISSPSHGTVTAGATNGTFDYTPDPDYNGPDSFTYGVTDRGDPDDCGASSAGCDAAKSDQKTVSLTVTPVNDAPTATDASGPVIDEDSSATAIDIRPLVNDIETADSNLTYAVVSGPSHGSVTAGATNGTFDYTPDPNYNGPDSFTYEVTDRGDPDNCGAPSASCSTSKSAQGTLSLTVQSVNDAPTAHSSPEATSLDEDTQVTITLEGSDTETAAVDLKLLVTEGPLHGTLSGYTYNGSPADVVYTPDPNYNGPDEFKFQTTDGERYSDEASVSITVNPVNDVPTAKSTPSIPKLSQDGSAAISLEGSDIETAASDLLFTIMKLPAHGTLSHGIAVLAERSSFSGSPKDVVYTPDAGYHGSDSFSYAVTDRGDPDNCGAPSANCTAARSNNHTVSLDVAPGPSPPPAAAQQSDAAPVSGKPVEVLPIDQLATLPRRCASRRHFRIRLRAPLGEQPVEARVYVNGRQVRVVKGQRLMAPVDLRGLPKGRFKVRLLVTTASGRQFTGTRRYRTCTPRITSKHKRPPRL